MLNYVKYFIKKCLVPNQFKGLNASRYSLVDVIKFRNAILSSKVYLGGFLASNQMDVNRKESLANICLKNAKNFINQGYEQIRILEFGSWAGGSALTMGKALLNANIKNFKIYCVDPWQPYIDTSININSHYKIMEESLSKKMIFNLFEHNINVGGLSKNVIPIITKSEEAFSILKENQFHFVFIDANHHYPYCYNDIVSSQSLVIDNGVLCGDDLELQYEDVKDILNDDLIRNIDCHPGLTESTYFHPGVTYSVWKFANRKISAQNGFWALRKANGSFIDWNF